MGEKNGEPGVRLRRRIHYPGRLQVLSTAPSAFTHFRGFRVSRASFGRGPNESLFSRLTILNFEPRGAGRLQVSTSRRLGYHATIENQRWRLSTRHTQGHRGLATCYGPGRNGRY
ncbi:hypothetical protein DPEC_G00200580 [Dallia pectoralis]|uniref:Uncharacterized protein n=1 Tax=Dallia pectoralis TaxID=75939 RepID=A0ACC2G927_DALPE|nr:hypothetical protein DPEC_G00200580 [Dallia pectoralis]